MKRIKIIKVTAIWSNDNMIEIATNGNVTIVAVAMAINGEETDDVVITTHLVVVVVDDDTSTMLQGVIGNLIMSTMEQ